MRTANYRTEHAKARPLRAARDGNRARRGNLSGEEPAVQRRNEFQLADLGRDLTDVAK